MSEDVFRTASCLDGGATPVGVQNCGGFTGSGIVIGHLCGGITHQDGKIQGSTGLAHELLHKVYHRFKEQCGTVLCQDARKSAKGGCPEVVGRAARWAAEVILAEFTDYKPEAAEKQKEPGKAKERPKGKPGKKDTA